jgi:hypothetical protein
MKQIEVSSIEPFKAPVLKRKTDELLSDSNIPFIPVPSVEKYGTENIKKLLLIIILIVKTVMFFSSLTFFAKLKYIPSLLHEWFTEIAVIKEIKTIFTQAWLELKDLSQTEARELLSATVDSLCLVIRG